MSLWMHTAQLVANAQQAQEAAFGGALGATSGVTEAGASAGATVAGMQLSGAIEVALVLTLLSILPAVLITVTSFTRIVIVLSFVRRSLAVQELPPNPVIIGLALFLTTFVMGPVFTRTYERAYVPYKSGEIGMDQAGERAWSELRGFLVANTRQSEIDLFVNMATTEETDAEANAVGITDAGFTEDAGGIANEELSFRVIVPAFVLSELKTAFQMGFLLFLPFLVIDLVVASVLISMGMFMLPPIMISTPFKILLFVLVDGWHLVCESLVTSFIV
jgi:flagellar biosynthetic protein FliP